MDNATALIPFEGARLVTAAIDGVPHVAMRPIVEHLGLDWSAQYRRIMRNEVLSTVAIMNTLERSHGRPDDMLMLPIGMLSGWLFGVRTSMVRPELRDLLLAYQRESFAALDAYWREGVAVNPRIRILPDDEPWHVTEQEMPIGSRFRDERERWEARTGAAFTYLTKRRLQAMEGHGDFTLSAGEMKTLISAGFDLRFVLHGERTLTTAERDRRDGYRLGTPEDREAINRHHEAIRLRASADTWDGSARPMLRFAGSDTVPYEQIGSDAG
jgi:hypothetical protein